jgi:hypothetical protein
MTELRCSRAEVPGVSDLFIALRGPGGQMKAWDFSVG